MKKIFLTLCLFLGLVSCANAQTAQDALNARAQAVSAYMAAVNYYNNITIAAGQAMDAAPAPKPIRSDWFQTEIDDYNFLVNTATYNANAGNAGVESFFADLGTSNNWLSGGDTDYNNGDYASAVGAYNEAANQANYAMQMAQYATASYNKATDYYNRAFQYWVNNP